MPPPLSPNRKAAERAEEPLDVIPVLHWGVRAGLVGIAVGLLAVFGIALWLDPYGSDGQARKMETHRQLGLPPCTFYGVTRLPCPSCGMTTSFALLVRGDVWNSLRANAVGTLLAVFWLALIPWGLVSAIRGQAYLIGSIERGLLGAIIVFVALLLGRWAIVLALSAPWGLGRGP